MSSVPSLSTISVSDTRAETFDHDVFDMRDELVVVYFWGPDCPNCEIFARDLPLLLERLEGVRVRIVKLDAYTHPEIARRFGLFGIPTFLLIKDGKKIGMMREYRGRDFWTAVVREQAEAAEKT